MAFVTDRNAPGLREPLPSGQQRDYLVLSEEERAKEFVRPLRTTYRHVGARPTHPTRDLTAEERERYAACDYVAYETYPDPNAGITGRFWTARALARGCGSSTTMSPALAETYARDPKFYGATFCASCREHFPVAEFRWVEDGHDLGIVVGS